MTNYFEMYTQTHKLNLRPFYHLTFKCDLDLQATSPVKLWGNLKQIATKGCFAVMISLDLLF